MLTFATKARPDVTALLSGVIAGGALIRLSKRAPWIQVCPSDRQSQSECATAVLLIASSKRGRSWRIWDWETCSCPHR